jgi:hypothetical protein
MYKLICKTEKCDNQEITYYIPEATDPTMCGGCKTNLKPIKMTKTEFDKIFDYDPFLITPINHD